MDNLDSFTDEEFHEALKRIISALVVGDCLAPSKNPRAILLGGQSGAGKSTLHNIYHAALEGNVIVVNGDEYRSYHPHRAEIAEQYGIDAPAHTAEWAGKMVEAVINSLSIAGYNLVIEGTLRTSDVPLKTAALLRERGYKVSLALMAVKPEISLVSCRLRYEQMRLVGTEPRAVDPAHHLIIVESIVDNLATLEASGVFESISLYSRSEQCLFSSHDGEGSAHKALERMLFGDWTEEECEHLAYLERRLTEARSIS